MFGLEGLSNAVNNAVTGGGATGSELPARLYTALANWFSASIFPLVIGAGVFITILFVFYGSFLYFTAYGDENRATLGKKTITYAFIGLIIVSLAFGIVSFVQRILIKKETGGVTVPTGAPSGEDVRQQPLPR